MSAWICTATHIATCAKIIHEKVLDPKTDPRTEMDIRMLLAKENVASVAWRYGREHVELYVPMINKILEKMGTDEKDVQIARNAKPVVKSINKACFGDSGHTVEKYFEECRTAEPVEYTDAEAHMHIGCLNFQSCEPPEWEASEAHRLLLAAKKELPSEDEAERELDGRHVWGIPDPEPEIVPEPKAAPEPTPGLSISPTMH